MGITKRIPREQWKAYFDGYTRRYLENRDAVEQAAEVEVLSPTFGDQFEVTRIALEGMTYDEKSNAFELSCEGVDHLVFHPTEIAVIEEDDGFVSDLEILSGDDEKQLVHITRGAAPAYRYEPPPPPTG